MSNIVLKQYKTSSMRILLINTGNVSDIQFWEVLWKWSGIWGNGEIGDLLLSEQVPFAKGRTCLCKCFCYRVSPNKCVGNVKLVSITLCRSNFDSISWKGVVMLISISLGC